MGSARYYRKNSSFPAVNFLLVFVYDLPPRFNHDLYECFYGTPWEAMNRGLGNFVGHIYDMPLYATDQFALEAVFHSRLLSRKDLLVSDPAEANVFYVPYYAHLAYRCLRAVRHSTSPKELIPFYGAGAEKLDKELWEYVGRQPWIHRHKGADHAMIAGAIGAEVTGTTPDQCTIGMQIEARKFTMGAMEHTDPMMGYPSARMVPVPYTSSLHCTARDRCGAPAHAPQDRGVLALFIGSPHRSALRKSILDNFKYNTSLVKMVDPGRTLGFMSHMQYYFDLMSNSTFCLEPGGDSPTRKGFFDALLAGCIPVVFEECFLKSLPFSGMLSEKHEDFMVLIRDPRTTLQVLLEIAETRLDSMREAGRRVAWQLNYAVPGSKDSGDAVELFLQEALSKSCSMMRC